MNGPSGDSMLVPLLSVVILSMFAGAVTLEEGSGELKGTGVPVAEAGWLVSDADTRKGVAGGSAAASAIPATIAARPPTAPRPSNTGVQEEA
jgi:hypothetical protein